MKLTREQTEIFWPFIDATISCLETMAGLRAVSGQGKSEEPGDFSVQDFVFVIDTTGDIEGRIIMQYQMDASLNIGNKIRQGMLGDEYGDSKSVDDDIIAALSEFSNTMIGRAIDKIDKSVRFSPPRYVASVAEKEELIRSGIEEILSMPLDVEGVGRFHVNYLIQTITGEKC
jgi:CheY-specific phosphatase CheX